MEAVCLLEAILRVESPGIGRVQLRELALLLVVLRLLERVVVVIILELETTVHYAGARLELSIIVSNLCLLPLLQPV